MAREITPVVLFGYGNDRFLLDNTPSVDPTNSTPSGMELAHRKDFRPQPIVEIPTIKVVTEEEAAPKASSATVPAPASPDGSPTSQSDGPANPAQTNAEKEKTDPLVAPPLL